VLLEVEVESCGVVVVGLSKLARNADQMLRFPRGILGTEGDLTMGGAPFSKESGSLVSQTTQLEDQTDLVTRHQKHPRRRTRNELPHRRKFGHPKLFRLRSDHGLRSHLRVLALRLELSHFRTGRQQAREDLALLVLVLRRVDDNDKLLHRRRVLGPGRLDGLFAQHGSDSRVGPTPRSFFRFGLGLVVEFAALVAHGADDLARADFAVVHLVGGVLGGTRGAEENKAVALLAESRVRLNQTRRANVWITNLVDTSTIPDDANTGNLAKGSEEVVQHFLVDACKGVSGSQTAARNTK